MEEENVKLTCADAGILVAGSSRNQDLRGKPEEEAWYQAV